MAESKIDTSVARVLSARLPPGYFVEETGSGAQSFPPRVQLMRSAEGGALPTGVCVLPEMTPTPAVQRKEDGIVGDVVVAAGDTLWEEDCLVSFAPFDTLVTAGQLSGGASLTGSPSGAFAGAAVGVWGMLEKQKMASSRALDGDESSDLPMLADTGAGGNPEEKFTGKSLRQGYGLLAKLLLDAIQRRQLTSRSRSIPEDAALIGAALPPLGLPDCYRGQEAAKAPLAAAAMLSKAAANALKQKAPADVAEQPSPTQGTHLTDAERSTVEKLSTLMFLADGYSWPIVDGMVDAKSGRAKKEGVRVAAGSDSVYGVFAFTSFAARLRMKSACNAELKVVEDAQAMNDTTEDVALRVRCVATKPLKAGDPIRLLPTPLIGAESVGRRAVTTEGAPQGDRDKLRQFMSAVRSDPAALERMVAASQKAPPASS